VTAALRDTLHIYVPNLVGVTMLGPGAERPTAGRPLAPAAALVQSCPSLRRPDA
jgi:hypothetical protein